MAYRYYRYTIEGPSLPQDMGRAIGDSGGMIVRVDHLDGRTEVTVAVSEGSPAATTSLGDGVEVREEDVLSPGT